MATAKVRKIGKDCYRVLTINDAGKRKTRDVCGKGKLKRSVRERADGAKGKYAVVR